MSDKKLSELDSNPNLSEDDLLYVVDDAGGDPESYKTTVGDVLDLLRETENTFTANQVVSGNVFLTGASDPTLRLAENNSSTSYLAIVDNAAIQGSINKYSNSGQSLIDINPLPLDGTSIAFLRLFRSTNTTGNVVLQVYPGNNTSVENCRLSGKADSFINALTGNVGIGTTTATEKLTVNGNVLLNSASDPTLKLAENNSSTSYSEIIDATAAFCRFRKIAASGISTILVDPQVTDGTSASSVSLFRETNTTGDAGLVIYRGNSSADINSRLRSYGHSFLNALTGNVGIGTTSPTSKFHVVGSGTFSDNLIVNKHIDVANRGLSGIGTDGNGIYIRDGSNVKQLTLYRATSGSLIIDGQGSSVFLPLKQSESAFNVQDNSFNTLFSVSIAGVAIGGTTPTAKLDISSNTIRLRTAKTPASATATGNQGDICWDADYVYICTATNTWKRSALSTW